jgi:hypothetical protein
MFNNIHFKKIHLKNKVQKLKSKVKELAIRNKTKKIIKKMDILIKEDRAVKISKNTYAEKNQLIKINIKKVVIKFTKKVKRKFNN